MFRLCRLCAKCPEPSDLTTNISNIESKLVICCKWKPSEYEIQMPNKACNLCMDKLQMCWNFVESVWAAEKQLNKLLAEQYEDLTNTEKDPTHIDDLMTEESIEKVETICELKDPECSFDEVEADDNCFR